VEAICIGFDGILAHKDAFRLKNDDESRRCAHSHTRHVTYCLRHGGTRYISHSRWYDDVTRRCAYSAHPVLSLIIIYRFWSIANGAFWNFTKFFAFSFARAFCTSNTFSIRLPQNYDATLHLSGKMLIGFPKGNFSIKRTIALQIHFSHRHEKLILNLTALYVIE